MAFTAPNSGPAASLPPRRHRIRQCLARLWHRSRQRIAPLWIPVRRYIVQHWYCLRQFALVLWIVRVPLTTTAMGLLILTFAPQAQDLFVEFARTSHWWILYFLFVLIVVWAMPTHYAARLLLDTDVRLRRRLPEERALRQKDANQLNEWELGRATCFESSAAFVPRLLGALTFFAVLSGISRSYLNLPDLDQHDVIVAVGWALVEVAVLVVLGLIGFVLYVHYRRKDADLPLLRGLKRANARLAPLWRSISPGRADDELTPDDIASRNLGRLILFGIFVIFAIFFAGGADFAAGVFPRALAVPFILGGWLPFLSYLSGLGRQWRAPLIAGLFGLVSGLTIVLGDDHSVRRIDAAAAAGHVIDISPLPLETEVTMWMRENGCEQNPATCPRPIIIAAEGGASRAGFFMASIIGYFMQEAGSHGLDPNAVRDRLFAISSVSGGSMGAVMVTAALDAKNDSNDYPCVQKPVDLWWGQTIGNWRDCFEALTSGDFLTADFFGFAFNDMWPFAFRDRAAVLEDSWTRRYQTIVTRADKPAVPSACKGLDCSFLALRPRPGHWIPLLVLNGTSEATGGRIITTSLAKTYSPDRQARCPTADGELNCPLFVQADRFHDLLTYQTASDAWFGWVGWYERYFLRNAGGNDVRLSTAAHNSARFPLISPPGSVRSNVDQSIVDRIVDGGYFENYGALGAKELALAIHAVRPQLAPLVIVISNDPDDLIDPGDDSNPPMSKGQLQAERRDELKRARAQVNTTEWVTDISTPVVSITNARTAHGLLGVAELRNALHDAIGCHALLMQIRVWPQYENNSSESKAVSMSWWLSTPIQRHLHQQTEDQMEGNQNGRHLNAIWQELQHSSCIPPEKTN
jgi:hypothetical protein